MSRAAGLLISCCLILHNSQLLSSSKDVCGIINRNTQGVYVQQFDNCSANFFCCLPPVTANPDLLAVCCEDCLRDVNFNPLLQPTVCFSDHNRIPLILVLALPMLIASLPVLFAGIVLVALLAIGKKRLDS